MSRTPEFTLTPPITAEELQRWEETRARRRANYYDRQLADSAYHLDRIAFHLRCALQFGLSGTAWGLLVAGEYLQEAQEIIGREIDTLGPIWERARQLYSAARNLLMSQGSARVKRHFVDEYKGQLREIRRQRDALRRPRKAGAR